jgi:hypothetical protein
VPERIEPEQPQQMQTGRHERFDRSLKEQTASPPHPTLMDQQRAFDRFRHDYNDRWPHEELGQSPPAAHYEPSPRRMPERPSPPEYGSDVEVRWVSAVGQLKWKKRVFRSSRVLASQPLGFRQIAEDEWEVLYGPVLIGHAVVCEDGPIIEPLS